MNADERKALNRRIAEKLGQRPEWTDDYEFYGYMRLAEDGNSWVPVDDYCGSLDATAAALIGKPMRLSLDFEEASAELEDMADEVDSEYGINRTYFGEPTSAADIAEAAALALDAWLTWRAEETAP